MAKKDTLLLNLFQNAEEKTILSPSPHAWNKIEAKLTKRKINKKKTPKLKLTSIYILGIIGIIFPIIILMFQINKSELKINYNHTINQDTINQDTINQDTINQDTINQDTIKQDTLNQK